MLMGSATEQTIDGVLLQSKPSIAFRYRAKHAPVSSVN